MSDEKVDLTGYKITVERSIVGWLWRATAPDGEKVPATFSTFRLKETKTEAQEAGLVACEDHARKPETVDAEALRERLA